MAVVAVLFLAYALDASFVVLVIVLVDVLVDVLGVPAHLSVLAVDVVDVLEIVPLRVKAFPVVAFVVHYNYY